jgi:lysylphosphatidylglycerol synthetase-like protein (DUF2156 family)
MTAAPDLARGRRPLGVAVIAVFLLVDALVVTVQLAADTPLTTSIDTLLEISDVAPGGVLLLAALRAVVAVGLWMGSRRAWVLTMVMVGIGLVVSLYLYAQGHPPYLRLAIDVVIAFYLNQGSVRDHFTGRTGQPAPVTRPIDAPTTPGDRAGGVHGD